MEIKDANGTTLMAIPADNLFEADLRGADLRGADLRGANLYKATLYEADLRGADLRGADLCGATLYEADLCRANLYGANLYGANLRRANLRGANLYGAYLCEANLYGADLRGAIGIVSASFDPRGYVLVLWRDAHSEIWINAGCHHFLMPEALEHWGSPEYPDPQRAQAYIDMIHGLAKILP